MSLQDDPQRFDELADMIIRDRLAEKASKEEAALSDGVIPGTLSAPWKQESSTWQDFFSSLEHDLWLQTQRHSYAATARPFLPRFFRPLSLTLAGPQPRKHPLQNRFPWLEQNAHQEKLEELDDPLTFMQKKTGLQQCLFCSCVLPLTSLSSLAHPL